jgi:hypothetical protein
MSCLAKRPRFPLSSNHKIFKNEDGSTGVLQIIKSVLNSNAERI